MTEILRRHRLVICALAIVGVGVCYWASRPKYGATSPEGYRYAVALFAACNQQDPEKASDISLGVRRSRRAGLLGEDEACWLLAIADRGLVGDWATASREVRRLMEDQQAEN